MVDYKSMTLGEYKKNMLDKGLAFSKIYQRIKEMRNDWFDKSVFSAECENCGYSKHVFLRYKKSPNHFYDNATLAQINSLANIVSLCPNCAWEFDNGLLTIQEKCDIIELTKPTMIQLTMNLKTGE